MKTRAIKDDNNYTEIVWFGSYGKNIEYPEQKFTITTLNTNVSNTCSNQNVIISCDQCTADREEYRTIYFNYTDALIDYVSFKKSDFKQIINCELKLPLKPTDSILAYYNSFKNLTIEFKNYGSAKYAYENKTSFSSDRQGIIDRLTQKLSVMRRELWYDVNYGLPILDKVKSKHIVDSSVLSIIDSDSEVISISEFNSNVDNHQYKCNLVINSIYGEVNISI